MPESLARHHACTHTGARLSVAAWCSLRYAPLVAALAAAVAHYPDGVPGRARKICDELNHPELPDAWHVERLLELLAGRPAWTHLLKLWPSSSRAAALKSSCLPTSSARSSSSSEGKRT